MNRSLKDLAQIQIGYQFRRKIEPSPSGKWRVIHIKDFDSDRVLRWDGIDRYALDGDPSRYLLQKGDVLFLFRGLRLFATVIDREESDTLPSGHFYRLRLETNELLPEFLAWCLNHEPGRRFMETRAKQTQHMPYVPQNIFREFEVPLPPIETQRKIVELEELRQKENSLMEAIRTRRATIIESTALRAIETAVQNRRH
jgi:restriction endonuclease S subunit